MLIPIKTAEAFLKTAGKLPINLKLVIEGEEERGSAHLGAFVAANAERLRADFVLSADGAMWRPDEPSITVANRGLAALEFTVTGAAQGSAFRPPWRRGRELAACHRRRWSPACTTTRTGSRSPASTTRRSRSPTRCGRRSPPCPSAKRNTCNRSARPPAWARKATRCWSGNGCARRWSSTACGAAIRGRAPRPSFRAPPAPRSPAAWCRDRNPTRSSP